MRRPRDERGSVLPVMALMTVVLAMVAGMAVDLGAQRSSRRDMQTLADVVALDLARLIDGRDATEIRAGSGKKVALETAKSASVARNKDSILGDDPSACTDDACVRAYLVDVDEDGDYPRTNGVPQEVGSTEVPDGVVVVASTEVGFAFGGLFGLTDGGVSRRALGMTQSAACFQLGSYAASISPASSALFRGILTPILGSSTLNAVGYNGLASAEVSILDLITAPSIGVGTVEEVLALPNLTVGKVFLAAASALTGQGKIAQAQVFTLAAASVVAPIALDFGDILAVDGSSDAVLGMKLNALDLLVGTAFLANGENLLNIPNLQTGLSSIGVTNTQLKIIERARRWCTGDQAAGPETSQLTFNSTIKIEPDNSPLVQTPKSMLRLVNASTGTPDATINASLNISLAGARAELTEDVTCDPDVFEVDVWTHLLNASLTGSAHIGGEIAAKVNVLGIGLVDVIVPVDFDITVGASAFKPAATEPQHVTLSYPPLNYGDHVSVGSGDVVLPDVSVSMTDGTLRVGNVTVKVLGIPVTIPTRDLLGAVNPVIAELLSPTGALFTRLVPLIQPLADKINDILVDLNSALGLNLGGADVYAIRQATCDEPRLRG